MSHWKPAGLIKGKDWKTYTIMWIQKMILNKWAGKDDGGPLEKIQAIKQMGPGGAEGIQRAAGLDLLRDLWERTSTCALSGWKKMKGLRGVKKKKKIGTVENGKRSQLGLNKIAE